MKCKLLLFCAAKMAQVRKACDEGAAFLNLSHLTIPGGCGGGGPRGGAKGNACLTYCVKSFLNALWPPKCI